MGSEPAEQSENGSPGSATAAEAVRGAKVLLGRDFAGRVVGVLANLAILRVVTPSEFGLASIGLTSFGLASFVSTLGLVASFLRRAAAPQDAELRAALGMQLLLSSALSAGALLALPSLGRTGLLIAVMISPLPLFALRTPASVMCGHALDFRPIALSTVGETVAFYALTGASALAGFGVWSFGIGMWARAVVGTVILLRLVPSGVLAPRWQPRLLRRHLGFATGYQVSQLTQLVRDQFVNVLVGSVGGLAAVGYWSLATRLIQPLTLVYSALAQVALPSLARLAAAPLEQTRAALTSLSAMSTSAAFFLVVLIPTCPFVLQPLFGAGWSPSAEIIPTAAVAAALSGSFDAVVVAVLLANGRARSVAVAHAVLAIVWLILIPLLHPWIGVVSVGVGFLSATALFCTSLLLAARDRMRPRLLLRSAAPIAVAGLLALFVQAFARPTTAWAGATAAGGLLGVQLLVMMTLLPNELGALKRVIAALRS